MEFPSWKTIKTEIQHTNPYFEIGHDEFVTPDGHEGNWYYHVNHNAVMVVGQLSDDEFVLIREYRYLHDKVNVGFVAGAIDQGESPENAAKREFQEEAGYEAGELIFLGEIMTAPAISKEKFYIYLAQDLTQQDKHLGDFENIEPIILSRVEVEEAISSGKMWDSNAIASWHLTRLFIDHE